MRLLRWTSSKTQEKSKDRFDKHATIRYFKFLVKVLIKGNKTPIGLGLENFQGPFYIWEVGRPLFLVRPSAITQSSVGSYHTTRLIKIHLLRLTSQLMFVFLSCSGYVIVILSWEFFWGTWPERCQSSSPVLVSFQVSQPYSNPDRRRFL